MAKFCANCGAALGEGARFCTSCGQAVAGSAPAAPPPATAPPPAQATRSGSPSFIGRIFWWLVAFGIAYVAWTIFYQVFGEI
jgi:hypothetical protein